MKCPVCKEVNLVMSERQGVEIDYCPECRGVWLDRGELDKIITRAGEQPAATPPQQPYHQPPLQPSGHGQGYHGQKPYRRKSFLEELFD
jgi:hypothetical protein